MSGSSIAGFIALVLVIAVGLPQAARGDPLQYSWTELAPDVWTGIRENSPRIPVMGSTTFVVGDNGVVVFDGGGLPMLAERTLAKVQAVTDKPVTHVVISHWHQDHNFGIKAFVDAYPLAHIISHPYTRDTLIRANNDPEGNFREGIRDSIGTNVEVVTDILEAGEFEDGRPLTAGERAWYHRFLADAAVLEGEYKRIEPVYPTATFSDTLVIHQGNREVQLLHLGRGNTAGDVVMWLPEERIVATGDMVVRPTPYGFGSYPREWADTLRRVKALDYRILIPGHGDVQRDARYIDLLIETLESVAAQAETMVNEGIPEEEAVARLDLSDFKERFTGGDAFLASRFESWFRRPIAEAAHRIAAGRPPEDIQPR